MGESYCAAQTSRVEVEVAVEAGILRRVLEHVRVSPCLIIRLSFIIGRVLIELNNADFM